METRTVDTAVLVNFAVAHLICTVAMRFLKYSRDCITSPLNLYIKQFYHKRMFHSIVRLDLPSSYRSHYYWSEIELSSGLAYWKTSSIWTTIEMSTNITMILVRLLSQLLVLIAVVWEQQDGLLLVVLSFLQYILPWDSTRKAVVGSSGMSTVDASKPCLSQIRSLGRENDQRGFCSHRKSGEIRYYVLTPPGACRRQPQRIHQCTYVDAPWRIILC
jgi:hypothetical protein